ncbi:hypothetical protein CLOP_g11451 [Closterium sp. NIES-67]|nr:hypothetical protein CLOP_g11451 [Closterium sp. NIES-67]
MAAVACNLPTAVIVTARESSGQLSGLSSARQRASIAPLRVASGARATRSRAATVRRPLVVAAAATETKKSAKLDWVEKRSFLAKNNVVAVKPAEAARLAKEEGHVIIDVRTVAEYNEVHPEGAVGVEFYRLIKEWTPYHVLRRAAFAFFGVLNGTEQNPDFVAQVAAAVPDKETPIILGCMPGGTLKPTQNFPHGKESRSLNAAHVLVKNGYKNVRHIEGGIYEYLKADLPVEYVE